MLLSAGAATALAVVTVLAGASSSDQRLLLVSVGWWLIATVDRAAARPARADQPADRATAGEREGEHLAARAAPERDPPQPPVAAAACSRCSPAGSPSSRRRSPASPPASRSSGRSPGAARTRRWRRSRSATARASTCSRTSPLRPMALLRTPGFKASRAANVQRRRHLSMPASGGRADVLIVSLGSTTGLRRADEELAAVAAARRRERRARGRAPPARGAHAALTDLLWARAARAAAGAALARGRRARGHLLDARPPRCCGRGPARSASTRSPPATGPAATALAAPARAPAPAPARRCCCRWSEGALREALGRGAGERPRARRAASRSSPPARRRRSATSPRSPTRPTRARRASTACSRPGGALRRVAGAGAELLVAGASPAQLSAAGHRRSRRSPACASWARWRARSYRALLRRARVFVCAPRREDYGIAQLEALADGCLLVTTPAPGPYAALPLARSLDPRLVGEDLAAALRAALTDPAPPATPSARAPRSRRSRAARATRSSPRSCCRACSASAPQLCPRDACWRPARRVSQARRAVATPQRMFASVSVRWASESITIGTPARAAARAWTSERSRRSGLALISSIVPGARGGREHGVEVDRVGRAALDQAAGRVADRVARAGARSRRSCARSSPARRSRRRCARWRSPSRAARAARPRSRASRRAGC